MAALTTQHHHGTEGGSLLEGAIELYYKERPSVIKQTVDTFDHLLLRQIQIHQSHNAALFNATQ